MKTSTLYRYVAAAFIGAAISNIFLHDYTEIIADLCAAGLAIDLSNKTKNT